MDYRPNLRYTVHPDGTSLNKNASVIGLAGGMTL